MAIALTLNVQNTSTTDGTSFTTASVTWTNGVTFYVTIGCSKAASAEVPASVTGGPSMTLISGADSATAAGTRRCVTYRCTGDGSSGGLTITYTGSHTGCAWIISSASGNNTAAPVIGNGVSGSGTGTALSTSGLPAFESATNGTYIAGITNDAGTCTADSPFFALGSQTYSTPTVRLSVGWDDAEDTTPTMTAAVSCDWACHAFEMDEVAAGGTGGAAYYFDQQRAAALSGV